jgi:DNA repair protein RecN (Recombination protein N)
MLKLLRINNIALIPSLEIELGPGLTLLTGETGAGKSILIDALGLVLGDRASPDLIRSGEERATVEAVFEVKGASKLLEARGLPADDDEIVVRREVQASGKGRASVNGALVPVGLLRELSGRLAVVHGQHEPQGLLDPQTHLALVDHFAGEAHPSLVVGELFSELRAAEDALERLRGDRRETERRREMLEFQASEIERAGLSAGEEDTLRGEKARHANASRLEGLSSEAYGLLYDDEAAALARLGQVFKRVEELASIDPLFRPFLELKADCLPPLEDLARSLRDYRERLELRPGRLDEIESRLATVERLKKKYGATLEEVIAFGARCREELDSLGSPEEQEQKLAAAREQAAPDYLARARELSRKRRGVAGELVRRVQAELAELAMEKTRFEVLFTPADPEAALGRPSWTELGLERAEFLLSPNPGEELRPLARIASGGELSRIMLALKSVVRSDAAGLTVVFDEVDAGIGGRVAEVVGRKLKALAERQQVLCVTHLPQIAAFADRHLAVRKQVSRGRTQTDVDALSEAGRVEEVARMLGGETVTATARMHAVEMLKQSLRQ